MERKITPYTPWLSRFGHYERRTIGFRLDAGSLTDYELFSLPFVDADFLEYTPRILAVLHAKHHVEIRKGIAYLYALRDAQIAAVSRLSKIWDESARLIAECAKEKDPAKRSQLLKQYFELDQK